MGFRGGDRRRRHPPLEPRETVMALRPHFIKISDVLTRSVAGRR
jgi:hypothetical protein